MDQNFIKFHRNLVDAVIYIVENCIHQGAYADRLIESVLKSDKRWGARDRSFIAGSAYDIIRNYRLLDFCSNKKDVPGKVASYFVLKKIPLPDWEIFNEVDSTIILANYEKAKENFAIFNSYPDELYDLIKEELGSEAETELESLNREAPLVLRCNTLVTNISLIQSQLAARDIETNTVADAPDALVVTKKFNVFRDPLFAEGCFEIQDVSSQKVAPLLELAPGMRVIDACAGAGGKSLHIAALLQNKGRLICLDTEDWKLKELHKRAVRAKVNIIETRLIANTKVIKRLHESCDRLLLDVPCSGLGVLRRNPDAKWKIDRNYVDRMKLLQKEILTAYSKMLRPGGILVYATCSILPSENSKQIEYFCGEHRHFQLKHEEFISPARSGFDGFYIAQLKRI